MAPIDAEETPPTPRRATKADKAGKAAKAVKRTGKADPKVSGAPDEATQKSGVAVESGTPDSVHASSTAVPIPQARSVEPAETETVPGSQAPTGPAGPEAMMSAQADQAPAESPTAGANDTTPKGETPTEIPEPEAEQAQHEPAPAESPAPKTSDSPPGHTPTETPEPEAEQAQHEPAPTGEAAPDAPLTAREPMLTVPRGPSRWARVLVNPGYAPELLALAAVESLGSVARDWAAELRAAYPTVTAYGLARLAVRRFARTAGAGGTVAACTGVLAPVAEFAVLAWAQAGLVLHLAAAYGVDPTDRERAVDLLVLTRVHPNAELARAALATAEQEADDEPYPLRRATEAVWRVAAPLASQTAGWLAVRVLSRLAPGSRPLVAGAGDAAGTERLAHRAIAHYRDLAGTEAG